MNTNGKMINSNLDEMGYHGALYKKITKHYNITTILYVAVFLPYAIAMLISTSLTPGDGTTIAFFDALIIKTGVTFCGFMSCYKKNNVYVFCVLLLQLISLIICPTLGTFLDLLSLFGANKLLTVLAFVLGIRTFLDNRTYQYLSEQAGFPHFNERRLNQDFDKQQREIKDEFQQNYERLKKTETNEMSDLSKAAPSNLMTGHREINESGMEAL